MCVCPCTRAHVADELQKTTDACQDPTDCCQRRWRANSTQRIQHKSQVAIQVLSVQPAIPVLKHRGRLATDHPRRVTHTSSLRSSMLALTRHIYTHTHIQVLRCSSAWHRQVLPPSIIYIHIYTCIHTCIHAYTQVLRCSSSKF